MKLSLAAAVFATAAAGAVCAGAFDSFPPGEELDYGVYVAQQGRVRVIVGAYLTDLEEARRYIPLQVAVGVDSGEDPELRVGLDDFLLQDAAGNVYEFTTPGRLQGTELLGLVRALDLAEPLDTAEYFADAELQLTDFYPLMGTGTTDVQLGASSYLRDVIYFPRPKAGLDGELMLSFRAKQGMQDGAIHIRFEPPPLQTKHKQQAQRIRAAAKR